MTRGGNVIQRWTQIVASLVLGVIASSAIAAEMSYPQRPIRIIVPYPPGGSTDPAARALGQYLTERLGQPIVVDNRPGAGATLGHGLAAQATPDGYTLLLGTAGGLVTGPAFGTKIGYDPTKDYSPISLLVDVPFLLIVHPAVPAKNIKELIDLSKAQPGKVGFASPGVGTPNHLGIELLNSLARTSFLHVPYKGGAPALVDLMSGRVQALFGGIPYCGPAVQSGKARVVAVGHSSRVKSMPDIPTIAELIPGFNNSTWYGILGPRGIPAPIVARLNTEITQAVARPELQKQFEIMGLEPIASTPQQLHERIRTELARWTKLINEAGIRGAS
jgi:tripartite-type tricarboxylate transporter receptor subunit TctC